MATRPSEPCDQVDRERSVLWQERRKSSNMVNRVLHIAEFGGGASQQPMGQGLVWPVVVEGSIREFGHGFES